MDDDDERHPEPVVQQPRSRNGRTLEEIQAESNQIVDEVRENYTDKKKRQRETLLWM